MRHALLIALSILALQVAASEPPVVSFTENKGQFPAQVAYRALVPGGVLFVEHDALTYVLRTGGAQDQHGHEGEAQVEPVKAHAFRVHFEGAQQAYGMGQGQRPYHENYFIGNDPAKWGTGCAAYDEVRMKALYPGIDLRIDGRSGLKYDFLVAPFADASLIQLRFEGQDALELIDGRLLVRTTAGLVIEEAPVVYQETPAGRRVVRCSYRLQGDRVSFDLPDGYDRSLPLVIDPVLTFASYSGSTADNFGFTATYDAAGNLYGGGIVFGIGYPSTLGVLNADFNGGIIDIGLTKFSADGSTMLWSTYFGGSGNESPHSLVVNDNNELYVLASSSSADIPTTPGCYDATFHGGTAIDPFAGGWAGIQTGYGYGHLPGTDIVIAHFSADATTLIASTYVGGSGNDGLNNVSPLAHNYGDAFRGEIALDADQWPVVATSTQSTDIPVSANAPQTAFGGGTQDAYLFRMDPLLSTLQATFMGGSGDDSGYGVQFDSNGQIFMTGGTTSADLLMPGQPATPAMAGVADGYIMRYASDLSQLFSATYLGTSAFDQSYFVQLNTEDEVFVVGQTHGAYPVTPGKYTNAGSSQFIHKFDHDLENSLWSTVIGTGSGNEDVSPSAFLVSDCGYIYFSGWGGLVNHYAQGTYSTTTGLPVTADAFQSQTDGSDFYLMVLDQEAVSLNYATFFGGNTSLEHVDGGTSRFDKQGNVYQAVCAGCGGHDDFPTTTGAWSNTNNSSNCNLGVFKFNLNQPVAVIDMDGPNYVCLPDATASFLNLSTGGTIFDWDFGDGTTITAFEPEHTYAGAGTYLVQMVLSDEDPCTSSDTTWIEVQVVDPDDAMIDPVPVVCPGGSVQLLAHGGDSYAWLPAEGITDLDVADPVVQPPGNITYFVVVTDSCGSDTASIDVVVGPPYGEAAPDTTVCFGNSVPLHAEGGGTYLWSPGESLDDPTAQSPVASPTDTTQYVVEITTPLGCVTQDSMIVIVQFDLPVPSLSDTMMCYGASVQLLADGGDVYTWISRPGIDQLNVADPVVSPEASAYFAVLVGNACGSVWDSAFVEVQRVFAAAWPDTTVCPGATLTLHASGGATYAWSPVIGQGDSLLIAEATAMTYQVVASNDAGCSDSATVTIDLFPAPWVSAGADVVVGYGESTTLHGQGAGTLEWIADSTLNCWDCTDPMASPWTSTQYTVQLTDLNGCVATDGVMVFVQGSLFVPNTFTPNNDGINDRFFALGKELKTFEMQVFDRWGKVIFEADRPDQSWDGTYQGVPSPIDTYVWRIRVEELGGDTRTLYGHVTLVR